MGLNELGDIDGNDGGAESGGEQQSEKAKEKAAKSLAGIQRTKKDEKKAQRDNDHLHLCLRNIITSRKYDTIIPYIFPLFDSGTPSHIIIGAFSLIHKQASDIIRDHYTRDLENKNHRELLFSAYDTPTEFDDETIDPALRKRINEWIEDIFIVISFDPSVVMTDRFLSILNGKEKKDLAKLLSEIFIYFLLSFNIHISETRALLYSEFILKEVEKKVKVLEIENI